MAFALSGSRSSLPSSQKAESDGCDNIQSISCCASIVDEGDGVARSRFQSSDRLRLTVCWSISTTSSLSALIVPWWSKGESKPVVLAWRSEGKTKPVMLV